MYIVEEQSRSTSGARRFPGSVLRFEPFWLRKITWLFVFVGQANRIEQSQPCSFSSYAAHEVFVEGDGSLVDAGHLSSMMSPGGDDSVQNRIRVRQSREASEILRASPVGTGTWTADLVMREEFFGNPAGRFARSTNLMDVSF